MATPLTRHPHQLPGNLHILKPHDTFLGGTVAQHVYAAVPNDILVDYGKLLMDVRFLNHMDAGIRHQLDQRDYAGLVREFIAVRGAGDDRNADAVDPR